MNYRNLIAILIAVVLTGCKEEPPTASFTFSPAEPKVDETVTFTNSSTKASSYEWSFGDGTTSSSDNPTRQYSDAGTYTVELKAINEDGSDTYSASVSVGHWLPVAAFIQDKTVGYVDEIVTFTNQSEHAVSYSWSFGDGETSTDANPTHAYSTAGTFTIQLTATGAGGDTDAATASIETSWPPPVADFSMSESEVEPGEVISFTNESQYAVSYVWDFGDGTTSTVTDPTHSYAAEGIYTVQLTATGYDAGTHTVSEVVTVEWDDPVASFTYSPSDPAPDQTITFTNTSQNATSYLWDFGDGSTSTVTDPTHSYTAEGTYTVQLTATGPGGSHASSQQITVALNLSVTGQWDKTFDISGDVFTGTMNLVQHPDGSITGDFIFSDGSGYTPLVASSNISGQDIQIDWWLGGQYLMSYQGTVNATFDYMSGPYYANGTYISTWSATKVARKKASIATGNITNPAMDRLLDVLKKK